MLLLKVEDIWTGIYAPTVQAGLKDYREGRIAV